jgi:hypothetical protein
MRNGNHHRNHLNLPGVRRKAKGDYAGKCLPAFLRVHSLPHNFETEVGRLLRVLFIRGEPMPGEAERGRERPAVVRVCMQKRKHFSILSLWNFRI